MKGALTIYSLPPIYHGLMTQVLLTVDTALSWAAHDRGASWRENLAASFDPRRLDLLRDHGLKACFFVDPMPALVYGLEPVRRMVEPILAAGQDVQLHLHPVWQSVAEGVAEGARFELTCFDAEDQLDLIETARDLLVEAGAPPPVAFRSGGYAADVRTLAALLQAGLRFDSSHLPGKSALPLETDLAGPADLGGVVEIPVALQLGTASGEEIEAVLGAGHSLVTLAVDGCEADGGFEEVCALLAAKARALPTVHFTDLEPAPAARALPPQAWRQVRRMAEQAWPDALYARSR
jgi:peptidoglycan/xylan/chitin deacetylase (PgdA/CDA1 family)